MFSLYAKSWTFLRRLVCPEPFALLLFVVTAGDSLIACSLNLNQFCGIVTKSQTCRDDLQSGLWSTRQSATLFVASSRSSRGVQCAHDRELDVVLNSNKRADKRTCSFATAYGPDATFLLTEVSEAIPPRARA